MSDDSDLEKSHPASQQRLDQAREKGQVPRSRELASLLMLGAGVGGVWMFSSSLAEELSGVMRASLAFDAQAALDATRLLESVGAVLRQGVLALLPLLGLLWLAALVAPLCVGGWNLSTQALMPQFSRLDPLQGLVRMASTQALGELLKALAKAALIAAAAGWVLWRDVPQLLTLMQLPLVQALPAALQLVGWTCAVVLAPMLLIAAVDVPWQLWTHHRNLRMTLEEVKKEHKESEGDPHIKAQIRRQRQQMARRRMMAEVPRADVVLTNPTHYAVALRYDEAGMRAPRVVAKGVDEVAERIKALAVQSRVPLLEAPPLARALFKHTLLGEEIPGALYTAVAEVLAWAMQLRRAPLGQQPPQPKDLPVPPELDPLQAPSLGPAQPQTQGQAA